MKVFSAKFIECIAGVEMNSSGDYFPAPDETIFLGPRIVVGDCCSVISVTCVSDATLVGISYSAALSGKNSNWFDACGVFFMVTDCFFTGLVISSLCGSKLQLS